MKTKYLFPIAVIAACLTLNFNAFADDGETNDECHIDGSEVMDAVIVLTGTSNAPAGATGIAKIDSENEDGTEAASVDIKMVGLSPGDYDLSITLNPPAPTSTSASSPPATAMKAMTTAKGIRAKMRTA